MFIFKIPSIIEQSQSYIPPSTLFHILLKTQRSKPEKDVEIYLQILKKTKITPQWHKDIESANVNM